MSFNKTEDIFETSEDVVFVQTFDKMNINPQILRGIYAYGMDKPSTVQKGLIHSMIAGRDIIAQAQSGTGKTSAFCIGAVNCVDIKFKDPQVIVISPTRELAQQIQRVCLALGSYKNLRAHACIGGTSIGEDIRKFGEGQHIVSGTPGRVIDMITRGYLNTSALKLFVIDEADQMLSDNFKPQIYEIYRSLPPQTQVVIVSATMLPDVLHLTCKFMTNPLRILVKRDELTLDEISQYFINVGNEPCKFDTLIDIYDTLIVSQAVIFCNSRAKVEWLADKLVKNNFAVTYMHGDTPQKEREELMKSFRCLETRVLVSTDLWSRGLDIQQISLVVNYDLPQSRETYIHRIGRAGRFGRKGLSINFVTNDEMIILRDIEQFYSTEITEMPMDASELV